MSRKKQRTFDPVSLSFLDVISCGFGAVVLIFLILDHSPSTPSGNSTPGLGEEISLLSEEIQQGEKDLAKVVNTISEVDLQMVQAQGLASSIQEEIDTFMEELARMENSTVA